MNITPKQIDEMIFEIAGQDGLAVYKTLKDKENVNEFLIAEKLKLTINQIRNVLYKFDTHNLVISTRKKDRKKGWYIYFWTFLSDRAEQVYVLLKKNRLKHLENRLEREKAFEFYLCTNKCTRMTIENAMEQQYMCPECGQLMSPDDNAKTIARISQEIKELSFEIQHLETPPSKSFREKKVELAVVKTRKKK